MPTLAVAATSARMLAEAAAQDGFSVIALDVFGDRDTRRVSAQWWPIGTPGDLAIQPHLVIEALQRLARRGDVAGWVPGSGFEGLPALLQHGASVLPLIGTSAAAVRRVRDPESVFGFLDAVHVAHPQTRLSPPPEGGGWLMKRAGGSGGWHIRHASARVRAEVPEDGYFQRLAPGVPMSATYIANGVDACVLGFNELIVRSLGGHPYVYCGSVGPVPLRAEIVVEVTRAVGLLVEKYELRGLGSLDFMLDDDVVSVLEVNPRPSASMVSYATRLPGGVMAAHVSACRDNVLPQVSRVQAPVIGNEIVFARRTLTLTEPASACLAQWPGSHDLPVAGASFAAGDPVCSVSATGITAGHVRTQLTQRRKALLNTLETWS